MANSRMDDLRMVDPVLTTVAQGYKNENLIYSKLFPEVQVSKLKGKIPVFGKDAFIIRDTVRAVRAASNRIAPTDLQLIEFETRERDVETAIDYIEEEESSDLYSYEQRITKELSDIMQLGKEKEAADIVQDLSNYDTSLKEEITSAEAFDDPFNSINPITIIRDAINSIRLKIGRYPNTMVIGHDTYRVLKDHAKIVESIKYSGLSKVTAELLGKLADVENVYIGKSVYTEDAENFSDVWKDNIVLAYVDNSRKRSEFNPSFGYTFQREGMPEIDSYYENGGKIKVIRSTDNYTMKITGADAAFLIYHTNHN